MSDGLGDGDPPAGLRLTTAEWGLWQAFRNGSVHDLRSGDPEVDDPSGGHPWGPERAVRARVIASLLLHGPPPLLGRVASLHLVGAYVTGRLDLAGGVVEPYLELKYCRFEREVSLREGRLPTARIVGCHIPRLEAARLTTEGDLQLPRCTLPEGLRLTDATIGTDLMLNEVVVGSGERVRALSADGLNVAQDLQASLLTADGEVSLRGAQVGGSLYMYGSVLRSHQGRYALNAPQLTVARAAHFSPAHEPDAPLIHGTTPPTGTWVLSDGADRPAPAPEPLRHFECHGGVKLDDGTFGNLLAFERSSLRFERDQELSLRRVQTPELRFTPRRPEQGRVVLSGATVENLVDAAESWPVGDGLWMAGFTYQHLIPRGPFPLERRLQWLATATPEFSPEPYEQLATVLRNSGEDDDARRVLLEKHRRRRETLGVAGKVWGYVQDWAVAYGYRPGRALVWMAVLWAAGTVYFSSYPPTVLSAEERPHWNAPLYALDLLLPVITLGHKEHWTPAGHAQWTAAVLILLGWTLATTVAAGATRLLRRQ